MSKTLDYILYGVDQTKQLLYSKTTVAVKGDLYQESMLHLAQIISSSEIKMWIYESADLGNISIEDQEWTKEVLTLILTQSRLKYIAAVLPPKTTSRTIAYSLRDKVYRIYGKNIGIEFFDTVEEAKAWILPNLLHYKLPELSVPAV